MLGSPMSVTLTPGTWLTTARAPVDSSEGKCQNLEHAIFSAMFAQSQPSHNSAYRLPLGLHQQILQRAKSLPEHTALFRQGHLLLRSRATSEVVPLFVKCLAET